MSVVTLPSVVPENLSEPLKAILGAIEEVTSADGFKVVKRWIKLQSPSISPAEASIIRNALHQKVTVLKSSLDSTLEHAVSLLTKEKCANPAAQG